MFESMKSVRLTSLVAALAVTVAMLSAVSRGFDGLQPVSEASTEAVQLERIEVIGSRSVQTAESREGAGRRL